MSMAQYKAGSGANCLSDVRMKGLAKLDGGLDIGLCDRICFNGFFCSALIGLLIMLILNDWILTEDLSETKAKLTTIAKLSKKDKNVWF